jgi:hypothetical protein
MFFEEVHAALYRAQTDRPITTNQLTISMKMSSSWEAVSCAATQRISQHFMEPQDLAPWTQEPSTGS